MSYSSWFLLILWLSSVGRSEAVLDRWIFHAFKMLIWISSNVFLASLIFVFCCFFFIFIFIWSICFCACVGDAFPWTVTVGQFSVYTLLGHQHSLSLLEPVGCTSTLAVTSHKLQPASTSLDSRHAFIICLHVDLQSLYLKISNPQVQHWTSHNSTFRS